MSVLILEEVCQGKGCGHKWRLVGDYGSAPQTGPRVKACPHCDLGAMISNRLTFDPPALEVPA